MKVFNGFTQVAGDEETASQEGLLEGFTDKEVPSSKKYSSFTWTMIHSVAIFIYLTVFGIAMVTMAYKRDHGPGLIYSPARNAVQYEKVLFQDDISALNPYRGPPRAELDTAWHELVQYSNIRVSADDLRRINRTSVMLSDGSGDYMAELNVHHQLHCLKVIRQALHPESYDGPKRHMSEHLDHCLDNIRQLVMCKADISLQTYDWVDNNPRPFANFKIEHECVNFEAINDWSRLHSFDVFDGEILRHPTLGPSFPVDSDGVLIVTEDEDPLKGNIITDPL